MENWNVYIVRCVDDSLYTGIAKDVARRVEEHNANNLLAANYTRARRPVTLVYQEAVATRSAAGKREYEVKRMSRAEKEALIGVGGPSPKS
jgi:putative endonuclease